jgi:hypothetical protein
MSSFCVFSQNILKSDTILIADNHIMNWQTYFENNQIKIEYKPTNCDPEMGYDNESIILKFTNLTSEKITITWNSINYYDKKCNSCNFPNEYFNELSIAGNSTVTGDCSIYADKRLKIFSKFTDNNAKNGVKLTSFSLGKLQITLN